MTTSLVVKHALSAYNIKILEIRTLKFTNLGFLNTYTIWQTAFSIWCLVTISNMFIRPCLILSEIAKLSPK
uniref:Uncharacterized protein n=1 Tax=Arundo donax TaxID=35708 RepID=A0A0A9HBE3_ARUDO